MQERLPPSKPAGDEPSREGQDEIDSSKAPLLDHLIELRSRLIWALASFVLMFFVCFSIAGHIYNVLVWPYMWASGNDHVRLIATHFLEQIMTQVKLAMFGAAFLSFPVVATQIYKFVAPGLYKNERRAFLPYLIATPIRYGRRSHVVLVEPGSDKLIDLRRDNGTENTAPNMATTCVMICSKCVAMSRRMLVAPTPHM